MRRDRTERLGFESTTFQLGGVKHFYIYIYFLSDNSSPFGEIVDSVQGRNSDVLVKPGETVIML